MKIFLDISSANRANFRTIKIDIENSETLDRVKSAMLGVNWDGNRSYKYRDTLFTDN